MMRRRLFTLMLALGCGSGGGARNDAGGAPSDGAGGDDARTDAATPDSGAAAPTWDCTDGVSMAFEPVPATTADELTVAITGDVGWAYVDLAGTFADGAPADVRWGGVTGTGPFTWTYTVCPLRAGTLALTFTADMGGTWLCDASVPIGAGEGDPPCAGALPPNPFGIGLVAPGDPTQLDQARALAGRGGHVKLIFAGVTNGTTGPDGGWIDALDLAYDRDLVPVVRVNGPWGDMRVVADDPPANTTYATAAAAMGAVVGGLPRRPGRDLFIEVWNEPNLAYEWGGECDHDRRAREYARFLAATADAIDALGDDRVKVTNAGLAPGGDDCVGFYAMSTEFLARMQEDVPDVFEKIDAFASHSYPFEAGGDPWVPPPNQGLAWYAQELDVVGLDLDVYLTETGYATSFGLDRATIADYTVDAYALVWLGDAIVKGVMPFELSDPGWEPFNWIEWGGPPYPVYDAVQSLRADLGYED